MSNELWLAGEPRENIIENQSFYKTMIMRRVDNKNIELVAQVEGGDTAEENKELADFIAKACTNQARLEEK